MKKIIILSVLSLWALSACTTTTTPLSLRNTASSLAKGKTQIDVGYAPAPSLSAAFGINSKWDVGVDLEGISSGWTRFTVLERSNGTAFAAIGGVFSGDINTDPPLPLFEEGDDALQFEGGGGTTDGVYAGILASIKPENTSLELIGELRYINSRYNNFFLEGRRGGIFGSSSDLYFNRGDVPFTVNSDDLEHIVQASFLVNFKVRTHLQINTGAICHLNISEDNPFIPDNKCGLVLGASFLRR